MTARRPPTKPANRALHDSTADVEVVKDMFVDEQTLRMPPVRPRGGPTTSGPSRPVRDDAEASTKKVRPDPSRARELRNLEEAPTDEVKRVASEEFKESVAALARLHLRLARVEDPRASWLRDELAALLAKIGKRP